MVPLERTSNDRSPQALSSTALPAWSVPENMVQSRTTSCLADAAFALTPDGLPHARLMLDCAFLIYQIATA